MIQKIPPKTRDSWKLLTYVLAPEKGHLLGGTLSAGAEVEDILAEFETFEALNSRVERTVFHASLRLAPGEALSDEQWLAAAQSYLQGMGFDDNAYVVARHSDGGSDHVHIVACRIRADGTCVSDSNDFARGERLVRGLEERFGLKRVSPSHLTSARALSRGELAQALRNGEPSARLELQKIIAEAAQRSPSLEDFMAALKDEGVGVVVHLDRAGAPRGLSFELDGMVLSGTSLGRGFTLKGLSRRFGLTWGEPAGPDTPEGRSQGQGAAGSSGEPGASGAVARSGAGSAEELRPRLAGLVRQAAQESPDLATFLATLEAQGVRVRFYVDPEGRPLGLSYRLHSLVVSGSDLGKDLSFRGLARHHAIDVEAEDCRELIAERAVVSGRASEKSQSPAEGRRGKGKGEARSREETDRLKAELVVLLHESATVAIPATVATVADMATVEPPEPGLGPASPPLPRFTAFGRAAEARGVEVRVFSHPDGEPLGIGYRYGGVYFRASSLGPELTLRGLNSYLSIPLDAQKDAAYLDEVTVKLPKTEYSPEDREERTRKVADSIAQAADGASGETREFLAGLEQAGISLRLYLSPEGAPRQVAYSFEEEFFTDKALGLEYGLKGLSQYFDLAFDPERDADLIASIAVRLGKDAVVDRETIVAVLQERILAAAEGQPTFPDFHQRLGDEGIKIHIYSDGKRQGLSYEHRGV